MGKIDELIQQYCPEGVDYVRFVDFASVQYGCPFDASHFTDDSTYIPLIRIRDVLSGKAGTYYTGEYSKDYIVKKGDILVGMDGNFNLGIWNDVDGLLNQRVCKLYTKDNTKLLDGFIKHYMGPVFRKIEESTAGGSVKHLSAKAINSIEIPLPPLPVQNEIVRILDNFTNLAAELQAELQARQQQYEYYKWSILENLSCPTKHITDIALVKARVGWQRLTTAEYQSSGDYYLITGTDFKNGQIDFGHCVFVSKERFEMDPNIIVSKGDILITKDGTLGKVAFVGEEPNKPTTLNSGVFRIHITDENVSPRYLFHYFTSKYFTDFVNSVKTGSTIPHLTQQGLVSLNIPIPSITEQQRIVDILDRFDTLTNDLTKGLPAEIEARQQQYEYYRDQLLTFKRKEA